MVVAPALPRLPLALAVFTFTQLSKMQWSSTLAALSEPARGAGLDRWTAAHERAMASLRVISTLAADAGAGLPRIEAASPANFPGSIRDFRRGIVAYRSGFGFGFGKVAVGVGFGVC